MDKFAAEKISSNREHIARPLQEILKTVDEALVRSESLGYKDRLIEPFQSLVRKKDVRPEDVIKIGSLQSEATLYHLPEGNLVFKTGSSGGWRRLADNQADYGLFHEEFDRANVETSRDVEEKEDMNPQSYHLHGHPNSSIRNNELMMSQGDIIRLLEGKAQVQIIACTDGVLIARRPRTALGRAIFRVRFSDVYLDPKYGPYDPELSSYNYVQQNKLGQVVGIISFQDEKFKTVMKFIRGEITTRQFLRKL